MNLGVDPGSMPSSTRTDVMKLSKSLFSAQSLSPNGSSKWKKCISVGAKNASTWK